MGHDAQRHLHRSAKEIMMGERITVRLPPPLKAQLAAMAEREGQDLSAVIRRLVQHALEGGQGSGTGALPSMADHPAPASHDQDTRGQIPPRKPSPQASNPAPLQGEGFISWQEYKQRFPQGSPEAARSAAAPPPAAPEPRQS
jgi:Ribbon-helix-helix protein, copG family